MPKLHSTLRVCLGEAAVEVGILRFESQGDRQFSSFQYATAWLENPRRFAISPSMPLAANQYFYRSDGARSSPLPPALADTTPDSWGRNIIRRDLRDNGGRRSAVTELDYLISVNDFSRLGALRVKLDRDDSSFLAANPVGRHDVPPLLELNDLGRTIADLERRNPITAAALRRLRQVGSSLGGARPKCSVVDADGSLLVAKFTSRMDESNIEIAEVLTLALAERCGILVPDRRLGTSDGLPVALIKRFDRTPTGRIPYISAQTMLEVPDAVSGTYVQIADLLRAHSSDPKRDLTELFRRIGFTILVSNTDDHLKNHGFLYDGRGKWRLSPMFDVNPSPERHSELTTPISDLSGHAASLESLVHHASFFDLDEDSAVMMLSSMAKIITREWQSMAKRLGMDRHDIQIFRGAFEHNDASLALNWGNTRISTSQPMDSPDSGQ